MPSKDLAAASEKDCILGVALNCSRRKRAQRVYMDRFSSALAPTEYPLQRLLCKGGERSLDALLVQGVHRAADGDRSRFLAIDIDRVGASHGDNLRNA